MTKRVLKNRYVMANLVAVLVAAIAWVLNATTNWSVQAFFQTHGLLIVAVAMFAIAQMFKKELRQESEVAN